MKKVIIYFASLLIGLAMFSSCEDTNEPILLQDGDKFVAFPSDAAIVDETATSAIGIPVYIAGVSGTGCSVSFDFDTTGLAVPAVEGVDFNLVNASKTLTFANYYGYDTIWITPVDDAVYTTDKQVNIVLSNPTNDYNLGANSTLLFSIKDDEHPLSIVIGDYSVSGYDEYWGADYSETVTIEGLSPTEVTMNLWNSAGVPNQIIASVDLATNTISFAAYQNFGNWGYGDVHFASHDGAFNPSQTEPVTAVFDANGDFTLENWGGYFFSGINEGLWWEAYYTTTWTKQ